MKQSNIEAEVRRLIKEFMGSDSVPPPKKAATAGGGNEPRADTDTNTFTPEEGDVYKDMLNADMTEDMSAIAAAEIGGMSKLDARLTLQDLGKDIEDNDEFDELNQKLDILLRNK